MDRERNQERKREEKEENDKLKVGMIIGSLNTFAIKISFELKKIKIF